MYQGLAGGYETLLPLVGPQIAGIVLMGHQANNENDNGNTGTVLEKYEVVALRNNSSVAALIDSKYLRDSSIGVTGDK